MNKRIKKLAAPTEEETRITDLERQLTEAQKRGIMLYRMLEPRLGWDDNGYQLVYCGYPTCAGGNQGDTQQLLDEGQGKLDFIKDRLLEIVEECEEIGVDPSYLFSMLDTIDPDILENFSPKEGDE